MRTFFSRMLRRFVVSDRGNIAISTVLVMVPLTVLLGGAIDLMRYAGARSEVQGAIDSGILDVARLDSTGDAEAILRSYIAANVDPRLLDPNDVTISVDKRVDQSGTSVSVESHYSVRTYFLHMLGVDTLEATATSGGEQQWQSVEVSMVLDISSSMNNNRLANLRSASNEFIDTLLDEATVDLTSINVVPFGGTVLLGDDFYDLVDQSQEDNNNDTNYDDGNFWHGCVELKPTDFNDNNFDVDGTYQIVPHFWKWHNFNPWCPEAQNEAIFLSNDATELKDLVRDFSRSDGTGMDIGAAIGLKALSPALRGRLQGDFANRPADYNSGVLKVLVMMTDGGITSQFRPRNNGCIRARNNDRNRNNGVNQCQTDLYHSTDPTSPYNGSTYRHNGGRAVSYFNQVCDIAKRRGITVYTIGFEIRSGSAQDRYLRDCATSASHYYFVESTDIVAAFSAIAANIQGVRLTR